MKKEYYSHHVNGVSYTKKQPSEFLEAILIDSGWIPGVDTSFLVGEFAKIRGEEFANGDAILASQIMAILVNGIPDLHDVDLPALTNTLLDLLYESL